jgi:selenocysteine lyase/cysteine desulfurase
MEHNAVTRPLYRMEAEGRILLSTFSALRENSEAGAEEICRELSLRMLPRTRMVVCTMASNVCSVRLPIREIGDFCRKRGILFVVDGAQGAGHVPVSVDEMGISALCVPGHKRLLGPQGCGALLLGKDVIPDTLLEGGNGVHSLDREMGDELPERYEAGTLPTPAIAGLSEGLRLLERIGLENVDGYERALYRRAREYLGNTKGVTLYAPEWEGAILLFNLDGLSPEEAAARLNEEGICVRSGYHCAGLGHQALKTGEGGAIRASFGISNRLADVDSLWRTVHTILRETEK